MWPQRQIGLPGARTAGAPQSFEVIKTRVLARLEDRTELTSSKRMPPSILRQSLRTAAEQAAKALPDDEKPVFLRLLGRMMSVAATPAERGQPGAASSPGGLIIPG